MTSPPICVVGATATGKTALALALAARLGDAELVSVDAMAVYRGLDIGTAKPTPTERAAATWHGLDLVEPDEEFSVARFREAIGAALEEIAARRHRAILVGGTGLYHRAVIDELEIPPRYPEVAAALERRADIEGLAALYGELEAADPVAAGRIGPSNRRRIVRALEVIGGSGVSFSSFGPGLEHYPSTRYRMIGLRLGRAELAQRIHERLERQLAAGFLEEVRELADRPAGLSRTARQALGYRELLGYLAGETGMAEATARIEARTRGLAKRQESWFARDPRISWLQAGGADLVEKALRLATDPERIGESSMGE